MNRINASEFKAKCLAILDEVSVTGESYTILKRGKVVAQLVPPTPTESRYPQDELVGSVVFSDDGFGDDLLDPVLPADSWDAERGEL